jgi:hypothetical protein
MNKNKLIDLIERNFSTWKIAKETNKSQSTVRHWLKKFGLTTLKDKVFKCKFCGETDKERFVHKGNGILSTSKCKKCHNKKTTERFREYKKQAVEYKGGKCSVCGYDKCTGSLHFHHRNAEEKDPNWKQMKSWSFDRIIEELDKCDLVCANCHGELHWKDKGA